jgi:hypothetical protein
MSDHNAVAAVYATHLEAEAELLFGSAFFAIPGLGPDLVAAH